MNRAETLQGVGPCSGTFLDIVSENRATQIEDGFFELWGFEIGWKVSDVLPKKLHPFWQHFSSNEDRARRSLGSYT
jgi:hypothetical protein